VYKIINIIIFLKTSSQVLAIVPYIPLQKNIIKYNDNFQNFIEESIINEPIERKEISQPLFCQSYYNDHLAHCIDNSSYNISLNDTIMHKLNMYNTANLLILCVQLKKQKINQNRVLCEVFQIIKSIFNECMTFRSVSELTKYLLFDLHILIFLFKYIIPKNTLINMKIIINLSIIHSQIMLYNWRGSTSIQQGWIKSNNKKLIADDGVIKFAINKKYVNNLAMNRICQKLVNMKLEWVNHKEFIDHPMFILIRYFPELSSRASKNHWDNFNIKQYISERISDEKKRCSNLIYSLFNLEDIKEIFGDLFIGLCYFCKIIKKNHWISLENKLSIISQVIECLVLFRYFGFILYGVRYFTDVLTLQYYLNKLTKIYLKIQQRILNNALNEELKNAKITPNITNQTNKQHITPNDRITPNDCITHQTLLLAQNILFSNPPISNEISKAYKNQIKVHEIVYMSLCYESEMHCGNKHLTNINNTQIIQNKNRIKNLIKLCKQLSEQSQNELIIILQINGIIQSIFNDCILQKSKTFYDIKDLLSDLEVMIFVLKNIFPNKSSFDKKLIIYIAKIYINILPYNPQRFEKNNRRGDNAFKEYYNDLFDQYYLLLNNKCHEKLPDFDIEQYINSVIQKNQKKCTEIQKTVADYLLENAFFHKQEFKLHAINDILCDLFIGLCFFCELINNVPSLSKDQKLQIIYKVIHSLLQLRNCVIKLNKTYYLMDVYLLLYYFNKVTEISLKLQNMALTDLNNKSIVQSIIKKQKIFPNLSEEHTIPSSQAIQTHTKTKDEYYANYIPTESLYNK
jgi:hypothetical protein